MGSLLLKCREGAPLNPGGSTETALLPETATAMDDFKGESKECCRWTFF
jgi:hypothetical protein